MKPTTEPLELMPALNARLEGLHLGYRWWRAHDETGIVREGVLVPQSLGEPLFTAVLYFRSARQRGQMLGGRFWSVTPTESGYALERIVTSRHGQPEYRLRDLITHHLPPMDPLAALCLEFDLGE